MPSEAAWMSLTSNTGDKLFVKTVSLGGGEIYIDNLDGIKTNIDGKYYYFGSYEFPQKMRLIIVKEIGSICPMPVLGRLAEV